MATPAAITTVSDEKLETLDVPTSRYSHDSNFTDTSDVTRHLLTEKTDLEAQPPAEDEQIASPPSAGLEYSIPTRTKLMHLAAYFTLNLVLTIYNKAVLGEVRIFSTFNKVHNLITDLSQFAFPWLLTALHTGCVSIGCILLLARGHFHLTKLSIRDNLVLVAFSFLFTINIAISNVSL